MSTTPATPQLSAARLLRDGPESAARRTAAALAASCLAILPLKQIFTDWAWLPDAWIAMALTIAPAIFLRMRWPARGIHLLPGLVLATCYLTVRYVPDHAWLGLLPLHGSWADISAMTRAFGDTVRDGAAPLDSTAPVRMVLTAQLVLFAVVIDLLAVVARRPALAGVPFLLLFTLAGAVPRQSVGWLWFALAAAGYLLLLGSDTRDEHSRWGRLMPRHSGGSRSAVRALSARRIGVIAILLAVVVPLLLPMRKSNLLADALHGTNGSGGGGSGVSLDPFVALKGQLNRKNPQNLLSVSVSNAGSHNPFYLRQIVLDQFDSSGWHAGALGDTVPISATSFGSEPTPPSRLDTVSYTASITINALSDRQAPIFQAPQGIIDLSDKWAWSSLDATIVNGRTHTGDQYVEKVAEPQPTKDALFQSPALDRDPSVARWLQVPRSMPPAVITTVREVSTRASSPYAKALALLDYFSPNNGFSYSLSTRVGDSGNDLVDFLTNKTGFCQQYAGAMAIMLRIAGVPARVVVGYTHAAPDENGSFTVTTNDAHAWVEAYFEGFGWIPFDPTPLVGADAARAVSLPWAPHADSGATTATSSANSTANLGRDIPSKDLSVAQGNKSSRGSGGGAHAPAWVIWLIVGIALLVIAIVLLPATIRLARRRSRLRAAARGPDPLWQELADTAIDLGYVWAPVRTPRQVVAWLRREGVSREADGSLQTLARAVELSRYAEPSRKPQSATLVGDLRHVEASLRSRRTRWQRAQARLFPESLGWLHWPTRRRRH